MPIITGTRAAAVTVAGVDGAAESDLLGERAQAVQVYGLPGVVRTADDTPTVSTTAPDAVRARVLDFTGAFICHLPRATGLRWMDEFNTAGAGSIDAYRYDDVEAEHPDVWNPGNQILISVGNVDVFRLVLDSEGGYRIDEVGNRVDTWAGAGALGVLNSGMCAPEYGWRPEATEERSFDYGSNPALANWYVPSEWKNPVGKLIRASWRWWYKNRHLPKGIPTKNVQWIWYRNPDATSSSDETCYFIGDPFTLSQDRRVKVWACGDDTLEFQLDGEVRLTTGPGGWKKPSKVVLNLSAGTHYPAAKVTNRPGSTGNQNRSGFLCAIGRVNGDGDVTKWLRLTSPAHWKVRRQLSAAPGWHPAQILLQLVMEQQDRGCAGHGPITYGFSTTKDSGGVGWVGRQERSIAVGTQALDYIQELVEAGIDVAMTPGLRLNAWRKRGADRSGYIRIGQGAPVMEESASQLPAIRNVAYARAKSGWAGVAHSGSVAARGRRETMLALGSSRSQTQTAATITSLLPDLAGPPQTIEIKISGASLAPQPYKHFNVGDWVSYRPAGATAWGRYRVMSIAGEVAPAGHPLWTIRLYED